MRRQEEEQWLAIFGLVILLIELAVLVVVFAGMWKVLHQGRQAGMGGNHSDLQPNRAFRDCRQTHSGG